METRFANLSGGAMSHSNTVFRASFLFSSLSLSVSLPPPPVYLSLSHPPPPHTQIVAGWRYFSAPVKSAWSRLRVFDGIQQYQRSAGEPKNFEVVMGESFEGKKSVFLASRRSVEIINPRQEASLVAGGRNAVVHIHQDQRVVQIWRGRVEIWAISSCIGRR